MKLETKGQTIMVLASLLLLAGCKQKSGIDLLNAHMSGLKALKTQYVIHQDGEKDIAVSVLYSAPNRILMTAEDFVVALNEEDGHFESIYSEKLYDQFPWDGTIFPGTGKLVSRNMINAGPAAANPPSNIANVVPWKLDSKKGGVEYYSKTVKNMAGEEYFKLQVSDQGVPLQFSYNEFTYEIKSFELVDEIPLDKFRVAPRDGFVNHRLASDVLMLQTGDKFDWSKFKAAQDVRSFRLEGDTMFVFIDPKESSSQQVAKWIQSPSSGFKKVAISVGNATSGFFDPTGDEIAKLTSSTPTFVMVGKDGKISGMWLGFDQDHVSEFEKDIQAVLKKED